MAAEVLVIKILLGKQEFYHLFPFKETPIYPRGGQTKRLFGVARRQIAKNCDQGIEKSTRGTSWMNRQDDSGADLRGVKTKFDDRSRRESFWRFDSAQKVVVVEDFY
ncbi:MAG TPA: hypothetical protein VIH14_03840 [Anaerolineales bacterium]